MSKKSGSLDDSINFVVMALFLRHVLVSDDQIEELQEECRQSSGQSEFDRRVDAKLEEWRSKGLLQD